MALQGTLDTFELPDVLRLLASTRKTGRLDLRSDRGEGNVWLVEGKVVESTRRGTPSRPRRGPVRAAPGARGRLRLRTRRRGSRGRQPTEVEPLLAGAEMQLAEWRDIEAVVPSLDAWVSLAPSSGRRVTVDADTWRLVATIGRAHRRRPRPASA